MTEKQYTYLNASKCNSIGSFFCNGIILTNEEVVDLLNENEQLKSIKKFADRNGICIFNIDEAFRRCWQDNAKLVKENEELKGRVHVITREYMDWKFSARKFNKKYQSAVKLLRVIKHELMTLNNLRLVDSNNDLVYVNFNDLLEKIEEVMK